MEWEGAFGDFENTSDLKKFNVYKIQNALLEDAVSSFEKIRLWVRIRTPKNHWGISGENSLREQTKMNF